MNLKGLSFENMPALEVPLRYFQTAPFFGMLAALLLLYYPESLDSRWQSSLLAFTHLLTLGFAATLMLGALFQVMPVVTGQTLPNARWLAPLVRWTLVCGTLLLAAGFLSGTGLFYLLASLRSRSWLPVSWAPRNSAITTGPRAAYITRRVPISTPLGEVLAGRWD